MISPVTGPAATPARWAGGGSAPPGPARAPCPAPLGLPAVSGAATAAGRQVLCPPAAQSGGRPARRKPSPLQHHQGLQMAAQQAFHVKLLPQNCHPAGGSSAISSYCYLFTPSQATTSVYRALAKCLPVLPPWEGMSSQSSSEPASTPWPTLGVALAARAALPSNRSNASPCSQDQTSQPPACC